MCYHNAYRISDKTNDPTKNESINMNTQTLVGRKENLVTDALSGLTSDGSIGRSEKLSALHRIHDDVEQRIEALEAQVALEQGQGEARHKEHRE